MAFTITSLNKKSLGAKIIWIKYLRKGRRENYFSFLFCFLFYFRYALKEITYRENICTVGVEWYPSFYYNNALWDTSDLTVSAQHALCTTLIILM